ncbi:hypothetical protein JHD48_04360 [Sulfurimonas sp. SAG-AH-194-I05]|nr:hypothetical protein [Sulfurimonas sp. SAG-AH-194-I05]MDF1874962.1 hypothetical protein [Sulfurimonas sp. SAG-AH-194-I05]
MGKIITIPDNRTGFSMKIEGKQLIRPDLHDIASDLSIATKDVLFKNGILTVYNTSKECQTIVDDGALATFVAMAIDIQAERITEMTAIKAKPKILEMDDLEDEDDD